MIGIRDRWACIAAACVLCSGIAGVLLGQATPPSGGSGAIPAGAKGEGGREGDAKAAALTPLAGVEARGKGPVNLVLVPGLSCDWTVFESFMERNAERYTMHAVTLPGFGGSEPPPVAEGAAYSGMGWLDNAERAIVAMIVQRGIAKPVVVGHSLGAHLAMRLGAHHPERIAAVVAIDGFASFPLGPPGMPPMELAARRNMVDNVIAPQYAKQSDEEAARGLKGMMEGMVADPARAEWLLRLCSPVPRATTTRYLMELLAGDVTGDLKGLKPPMLVIAAVPSEGNGVDAAQQEAVRRLWRDQLKGAANTALVLIENSRHFVTEDQPARLDQEVAKFAEEHKGELGR